MARFCDNSNKISRTFARKRWVGLKRYPQKFYKQPKYYPILKKSPPTLPPKTTIRKKGIKEI